MNRKGLLAILFTVFIWGSTFLVVKIGLQEIDTYTFAFLRTLFAAVFLMTVIFLKGEQKKFLIDVKADWKYFLLLGLGVALFYVFQNIGIKYTSSLVAGVLENVIPLFVLVLSILFVREIITRNKVVGLIVGFLGTCLILFVDGGLKELIDPQIFFGNMFVLASAFIWAVYSILNKLVLKKYSPLYLTSIAYLLGALFLFPLVLLFGSTSELFELSFKSWLIVLYLGVVAAGIAVFLWNYALSKMDVSKASAFLYLIPVIAILLGWTFLGEDVTVYTLFGTGLVLGGLYLTEKG